MTFEENVSRLERIIAELDSNSLALDKSLELFEEGVRRLRDAATELSRAEARVKTLVEQSKGAFELHDLDA